MKTKSLDEMAKNAESRGWYARLHIALERDKKLTAYDFNEMVIVTHGDGSCYSVVDAKTEIIEEHLVVYQEHGHPLVFFISDLNNYSIVKRPKMKKPRRKSK